MDIILLSFLSGASLALVCYDIRARLKHTRDLSETLSKLNQTHNSLSQQFHDLSDQVSRFEMHLGTKPKGPGSK